MSKLTLLPVGAIASAAATLNTNFNRIVTAIENTLSRDGTAPNPMGDVLDMNNERIINLPEPVSDHEPATKGMIDTLSLDIDDYVDRAEDAALASEAALAAAELLEGDMEAQVETARQWAVNPEDVPVSGGEFSSYHWAQKAQEFAGGGGSGTWPLGHGNLFYADDYGGDVIATRNAAAIGKGVIVLSSGKLYLVDEPVVLDWYGAGITSSEGGRAELCQTTATGNVIEIYEGLYNEFNSVTNLKITRSVPPSPGACGILQRHVPASGNDYLARAILYDLNVYNHHIGLYLGGTDFSFIGNLIVERNTSHGIEIYGGTVVALQWYWSGQSLLQHNGGCGLYMHTNPALAYPGGLPTGNIQSLHCYANGSYGFAFEGHAGCPLQGIRLLNCFLGDEGNDEIFFDTFGSGHNISNCYAELGQRRGIHFTVNNSEYRIVNCTVMQMNNAGIWSNGRDALISECTIMGNGRSGTEKYGVYLDHNRSVVVNNRIGNPHPGAGVGFTQDYGIVSAATSNGLINNNNFFGNNLLPYALSGTNTVGANIT